MSEIYLFTDLDNLLDQEANKEFASITPVSSISEKFQLTSLHSGGVGGKAYAIIDSLIVVQQNSDDPSLVNVILKPNGQSVVHHSNVEYIVYRGIKYDSIFEDGGLIKLSGNDLCDNVLVTKNRLEVADPTLAPIPPLPGTFGFGAVFETEMLLNYPTDTEFEDIQVSAIFNRLNTQFKGFPIKAGWHIGDFHSEYGID